MLSFGLIAFFFSVLVKGGYAEAQVRTSQEPAKEMPFGINNPYDSTNLEQGGVKAGVYLKDLGVRWTKDDFPRNQIENPKGRYRWEAIEQKILDITHPREGNARLVAVINPYILWDEGGGFVASKHVASKQREKKHGKKSLPKREKRGVEKYFPHDWAAYRAFVRELVERYDGDEDFGTYPIREEVKQAARANPIKYWYAANEPAGEYRDRIDDYVRLVVETHAAVKAADPEAGIILSATMGVGNVTFYREALRRLKQQSADGAFDIFDCHVYSFADGSYRKPRDRKHVSCQDFMELLKGMGFGSKPHWSAEGATYSGKDENAEKDGKPLIYQSEEEQAAHLIKRMVYPLSLGVQKIFWSTLREKETVSARKGNMGSYTGLVYNGMDPNTPFLDPGNGVKKLAYYAFKLLIQKVGEVPFSEVKEVPTGIPHVYAYQFMRPGKPLYVVWWDYFEEPGKTERQITLRLPVIDTANVKLTRAVPTAASGAQLKAEQFPRFFHMEVRRQTNGSISLILDKKPVYLEPAE